MRLVSSKACLNSTAVYFRLLWSFKNYLNSIIHLYSYTCLMCSSVNVLYMQLAVVEMCLQKFPGVTTDPPLSTGCPECPSINTPLTGFNCISGQTQCNCVYEKFTVATSGNTVGAMAEVTAISSGYCVVSSSVICSSSRRWTPTIIAERGKYNNIIHMYICIYK